MDYFYRKIALAQMALPEVGKSVLMEKTLQQFVNDALTKLCRTGLKGNDALDWLGSYLHENNPNRSGVIAEVEVSF